MSSKSILITGGAGYIGSHVVYELLKTDKKIVIFDNFSNSTREPLARICKTLNKEINIIHGDLLNIAQLEDTFLNNNIDSVIHFAGLKSVSESIAFPLMYYENNVIGSLNLFKTMDKFNVKKLIFSSSATVYGIPQKVPISEKDPTGEPTNPYGISKLMIEKIIYDIFKSSDQWSISILRYFNPIGAHQSGIIGEDPNGTPNNLMPYITKTALGYFDEVKIFGNDYNTLDGTGIRDFIHVVDLAKGHIAALEKLRANDLQIFNLGTGKGTSVLQLIEAFKNVNGVDVPYIVVGRRDGDIDSCYADVNKAKEILNWQSNLDINDMCADSWNWQIQNPNGYKT